MANRTVSAVIMSFVSFICFRIRRVLHPLAMSSTVFLCIAFFSGCQQGFLSEREQTQLLCKNKATIYKIFPKSNNGVQEGLFSPEPQIPDWITGLRGLLSNPHDPEQSHFRALILCEYYYALLKEDRKVPYKYASFHKYKELIVNLRSELRMTTKQFIYSADFNIEKGEQVLKAIDVYVKKLKKKGGKNGKRIPFEKIPEDMDIFRKVIVDKSGNPLLLGRKLPSESVGDAFIMNSLDRTFSAGLSEMQCYFEYNVQPRLEKKWNTFKENDWATIKKNVKKNFLSLQELTSATKCVRWISILFIPLFVGFFIYFGCKICNAIKKHSL